ncbi:MAG: VPLPA-CTERM sorting domain-containing protein [Proteobacteria bacterium]|nr:VPLPA-CTERM sorting domain-containing protein [Burkholderiales bacterium]
MLGAVLALCACVATTAHAAAIRDAASFTGNSLAANDDGSTGLVNLGFTANFYGNSFTQTYVNNNGNVTFNGPLSTFTPFNLTPASTTRIIAAFFADVDTRGAGSSLVTYGTATLNSRQVFGVNYINVGYFAAQDDKLNSFQLLLTERSDVAAGDFDIEFNYDRVLWETGSASGGTNGFGGTSAGVGFAAGNGVDAFQLAGSLVNGALLDGGPNALISNRLNSNVDGRYIFNVRNGTIIVPPSPVIPVPGALVLMLSGITLVGAMARRRKT